MPTIPLPSFLNQMNSLIYSDDLLNCTKIKLMFYLTNDNLTVFRRGRLTLPGVFLPVQVNGKVIRVKIDDGRILNQTNVQQRVKIYSNDVAPVCFTSLCGLRRFGLVTTTHRADHKIPPCFRQEVTTGSRKHSHQLFQRLKLHQTNRSGLYCAVVTYPTTV